MNRTLRTLLIYGAIFVLLAVFAQQWFNQVSAPEEIVNGPRWVRLEQIQLPYPKIVLNPGASDRFRHGQEVIVLRAGTEPLSADSLVTVRGQNGSLLGIGRVENILARGRTLNIRPAVVIDA